MSNNVTEGRARESKPEIGGNPRIFIFIALAVFTIISIVVSSIDVPRLRWWSDLWINLSAGGIGSLVTIFFIDLLLSKGRSNKLRAVNKINHSGFLSYVRLLMLRVMLDFSYIPEKEFLDYMETSEDKFISFLADRRTVDRIENLNRPTPDNLKFMKELNKTLKGGWESLSKFIKDFKPYPDPFLVHKINIEMAQGAGFVWAGEEFLNIYFNTKKISEDQRNEMQPGMDILWEVFAGGMEDPARSYKNYYLNSFNFLLELADRCKKENIFFDI